VPVKVMAALVLPKLAAMSGPQRSVPSCNSKPR
jgi:hypothetical protein